MPKHECRYEIDKDIPIPDYHRYQNRRKYPFDQMQVNDSIFVPIEDLKERVNPAKAIRSAAYAFGRRNGMKFVVRKESTEEDYIYGFRVWRIA